LGSGIIHSVSYSSDWQLPKFSDLMYTAHVIQPDGPG